jgi:hypothetical protein
MIVAANTSVPATPAPQGPAYQLFAAARMHWSQQTYPLALDYTVRVTVDDGNGTKTEAYVSAFNAETGQIWLDPVSDYERKHPATGHGVGFCATGSGGGGPAGPPGIGPPIAPALACPPSIQPAPDQDFIGVPVLSPVYSFGLGPPALNFTNGQNSQELIDEIRRRFNDPMPQRPSPEPSSSSQPHEIAAVSAYARDYTIALVGRETVDGHTCDHLTLVPVHDPGRYRLRDLWIDAATSATVRARIGLNFIDGPGTKMPWTIDFTEIGGATYIASETAEGPYKYARHPYARVVVSFENVQPRSKPFPLDLPFSAFLKLEEP